MMIDKIITFKEHNSFIFIIVTTIITVSLFLTVLPKSIKINESSDYFNRYMPSAEKIYNDFDFNTIEYYVPGYSIILSLLIFISKISSIEINLVNHLFQLLCYCLSAILIFKMANIFFFKKFAILCSLIWITYPPNLYLIKQPNSSVVFTALLIFIVYFFVKITYNKNLSIRKCFLLGNLLGLLMLIKPIAIGIGLVFTASLFLSNYHLSIFQKFSYSMLIFLGIEAMILPWQVFVFYQANEPVLLMPNSIMMIKDGFVFNLKTNGRLGVDLGNDVNEISNLVKENWHKINSISDLKETLMPLAKSSPFSFIKLFFIKFFRSFYATDSHRYETFSFLMQIIYFSLIIKGILKSLDHSKILNKLLIISSMILIYFLANSMVVVPILRYINPSIGFFFLFIPLGLFKNSNVMKGLIKI